MSSSSSDLSKRKLRWTHLKFMVPLFYAPILPLVRIGFRRNPVVRDRLFYGVLAAAFAHGSYMVYPLLNVALVFFPAVLGTLTVIAELICTTLRANNVAEELVSFTLSFTFAGCQADGFWIK